MPPEQAAPPQQGNAGRDALAALGLTAAAGAPPAISAAGAAATTKGIVGAFQKSASVLLSAANRHATRITLADSPDVDPALYVPSLASHTTDYVAQAGRRLTQSVSGALKLPTGKQELDRLHKAVQAAQARYPKDAPQVKRAKDRLEAQRGQPGPRERAVSAALSAEARHAAAHVRMQVARASSTARQAKLEKSSPGGAVWVLGKTANHTKGCLVMAGKHVHHDVLRAFRPPVHGGCACHLAPLPENTSAAGLGASVTLALKALDAESEHGHDDPDARARLEALLVHA